MEETRHLFIIWEKSRFKEKEIIKDISKKFKVHAVFELKWDSCLFSKNLIRLYGNSLPDPKKKLLISGDKPFLVIFVSDPNPIIKNEKILEKIIEINLNIVKAKTDYRKLVGTEFSIHGTISNKETNHDVKILFGKSFEEMIIYYDNTKNENYLKINQNTFLHSGPDNFTEFLKLLNGTINYLILRNFETFPDRFVFENHNDIDILTDEIENIPFVCFFYDEPFLKGSIPKIFINNLELPIDWKRPGDNFYDKKWYRDILDRKIFDLRGFYRPSDEDYFYTLFYHVVFHKKQLSDEYKIKITNLSKNIKNLNFDPNILDNFDLSKKFLLSYLQKNGYKNPSSIMYRISNNEIIRLTKTSSYIIKKMGIMFFLKEFTSKLKRINDNIHPK